MRGVRKNWRSVNGEFEGGDSKEEKNEEEKKCADGNGGLSFGEKRTRIGSSDGVVGRF